MARSPGALGVVEGLIILATLWWSWCAYSWLANQTQVGSPWQVWFWLVGLLADIVLTWVTSSGGIGDCIRLRTGQSATGWSSFWLWASRSWRSDSALRVSRWAS